MKTYTISYQMHHNHLSGKSLVTEEWLIRGRKVQRKKKSGKAVICSKFKATL
jgi:hypothetical protein